MTSKAFELAQLGDAVTVSSDNVGIGISSPSKKLDVDTTMRVTNAAGSSAAELDISSGSTWRLRSNPTSGTNSYGLDFIKGSAGTDVKMSIDSSGNFLVGTSSTFDSQDNSNGSVNRLCFIPASSGLHLESNNTAPLLLKRTSGNGTIVAFNRGGSTGVGSISVTTSSTSFNTSSDHRLKENVTGISDGITRVKQLAPKRFNFIADADTVVDGFLAHEAQAVVPEAVTGTHDEVDADGNAIMQGIDQAKLVPLLTAALQEAIAKIETLETENVEIRDRLDALEAN